jgi:hypothetical protein
MGGSIWKQGVGNAIQMSLHSSSTKKIKTQELSYIMQVLELLAN